MAVLLTIFCGVLVVLTARTSALSTERLEALQLLDTKFIQIAQKFVDLEIKEIHHLEKFLRRVKDVHANVDDLEEYAGDPISAFQLIKRYVMDWRDIHHMVNASAARNETNESLAQLAREFPVTHNQLDLKGVVKRLSHFQEINDFTAQDVIERTANGSSMSWHNCYEIGSTLFEEKKYRLAIDWLKLTKALLDDDVTEADETSKPTLMKFYTDIFEYLAIAYHELGLTDEAIEYFEEILAIEPGHNSQNFFYYINNGHLSKEVDTEDDATSCEE